MENQNRKKNSILENSNNEKLVKDNDHNNKQTVKPPLAEIFSVICSISAILSFIANIIVICVFVYFFGVTGGHCSGVDGSSAGWYVAIMLGVPFVFVSIACGMLGLLSTFRWSLWLSIISLFPYFVIFVISAICKFCHYCHL